MHLLVGIQLRPYQLDGVRWLTGRLHIQQGCILGDEMGLGKTCQVRNRQNDVLCQEVFIMLCPFRPSLCWCICQERLGGKVHFWSWAHFLSWRTGEMSWNGINSPVILVNKLYLIYLFVANFMCPFHFSFAPSLTVLCYKGDKSRRSEIQEETDTQDFNVLLTTYEVSGDWHKRSQSFIWVEDVDVFHILLFAVVSQRCFLPETVSVFCMTHLAS